MLKGNPGGESFLRHGTYQYLDGSGKFTGTPDSVRIGDGRAVYTKDGRDMIVPGKEPDHGEADRFNQAIPEDHKDWFTRGRGFRGR